MNQDKLSMLRGVAKGEVLTCFSPAHRSALKELLTTFDAMQVKLWEIDLFVAKRCLCYDDNTCTACDIVEILKEGEEE
jgi:hypothetical protein